MTIPDTAGGEEHARNETLLTEIEQLGSKLSAVRERISKVIFGQQNVIDEALIVLFAGGHALLIGVPGFAKTRLVETLGTVLGLSEKRVQFTPDLMPADIIGSEVLEESESGKRSFRFIRGPVFCQLLMSDEINRASPRTQSALLQATQEKHVSVAGQRHVLPAPLIHWSSPTFARRRRSWHQSRSLPAGLSIGSQTGPFQIPVEPCADRTLPVRVGSG